MKSTILKTALVAGVALAACAIASTASAKTFRYTLGTASGGSYCDGFTVTTTDKVHYSGTHTGSCVPNVPADGFASKISGFVPIVNLATLYPESATNAYTLLFSSKVMAWELWVDSGGVLTEINSGPLIQGAPPTGHRPGAKSISAAQDKHPHLPRAGQGLRW
jgi:hypothetical protein